MNHAIMYPDHLPLNQVQNLLKLKFPVSYLKTHQSQIFDNVNSRGSMNIEVEKQCIPHPVKESISLNDCKRYVNILQIEVVINVGINQLKIAYICSLSLLFCIMFRSIK